VLEYGGAEIQVLDLPGIIEGAAEGKGRGRQVISAAKTSDMILMVLDATKRAEQRALLEAELEAVGIRLNQDPPNIYLKQKKAGGMKITFQSPPKNLDEKMLYNILRDYRILNCEVLIRDENGTCDFLTSGPATKVSDIFFPSYSYNMLLEFLYSPKTILKFEFSTRASFECKSGAISNSQMQKSID